MNADEILYGLSATTITKINTVFAASPEIERVVIYGSRAKGNYHAGSDIDLSIISKQLTSSQISRIETELDDLLLPYKVDLSVLCKIQNADLLDHIERVGKTFFNRQEKS